MLKYISNNCFEDGFKNWYKNIDGILYYSDKNVSGRTFQVLNVQQINDISYISQVNEIYGDSDKIQKEFEFNVVNDNNNYVIDKAIER